MASRLWLPSSGASAISPAFDASWTITTGAVRAPLTGVPTGTSGNTVTYNRPASQAATVVLVRQEVSPALPAAKTISGDFYTAFVFRYSGDTSNVRARPRVVVRVVSPAGVVRGTLLVAEGVDSSGYANYRVQVLGGAVTPVNALAGDHVVVERGYRFPTANVANLTAASAFTGDPFDKPDALATDVSSAFDFRSWHEFSQDDIWGPVPRRVAGLATEVLDRSTNPSRRVGAAAVEVAGRASSPSRRVAALAVEVLRARGGQQRVRHLRQKGTDTEPLMLVPGIGWRAIRPVPAAADLPKPPVPLFVDSEGGTSGTSTNTAFSGVTPDCVLVAIHGDSNVPANANVGGPVGLGATWELEYSDGRVFVWIGRNPTESAGTVDLVGSFSGTLTDLFNVSIWRQIDGTVLDVKAGYVGASTPTTYTSGVVLPERGVALAAFCVNTGGAMTQAYPPIWVNIDGVSRSKQAVAFSPFGPLQAQPPEVTVTGSGVHIGALVVLE